MQAAAQRLVSDAPLRILGDPLSPALCAAGRSHDLIVIGLDDAADHGVHPHFSHSDLLLAAGRPVLLIPPGGSAHSAPQRALIAWNASREAARAAHDALPLLEACEQVSVVTVGTMADARRGNGNESGEFARELARHGLAVDARTLAPGENGEALQLLSLAAESHADLLVAGAWGHSRLRELMLGGVTRILLHNANVPVLMSH